MARYSRWAETNLDIVYSSDPVQWYARCPFRENHKNGDTAPSFGINVSTGLWTCYGCQEKGNLAKLAKHLKVRVTQTEASPSNLKDRVAQLREGEEELQRYPESWLDQFENNKAIEYWCGVRGLSEVTVFDFHLGYDRRTQSATIPLRTMGGHVLGVIRRRMDPDARPRYVYPKGFKITLQLWGANAALNHPRIAVCEGSVDALACWDVGIPAIALLGSRISPHQITLLNKLNCKEVVVMTDNDDAGKEAASRVRQGARGLIVSVGTYRKSWSGKDPAALTPQQRREMFDEAVRITA